MMQRVATSGKTVKQGRRKSVKSRAITGVRKQSLQNGCQGHQHGVQLPFVHSIIHNLAEPNLIEAHPVSALGDVPCGPCRACCRHDLIRLLPERGDLIWTYEHEVVATPSGPAAVLRCAKDGSCIYLGPGGCTIHDRAPAVCRAFDCRDLFSSKTSTERRAMVKSGVASKEVLLAGRQRLRTLDRL